MACDFGEIEIRYFSYYSLDYYFLDYLVYCKKVINQNEILIEILI